MKKKKYDLLVDMDGTICDWDTTLDRHVDDLYPEFSSVIPRKGTIKTFNLWQGQSPEVQEAISAIFDHPGFYKEIPEIPFAVEALHEMRAQGHSVAIVTSPWWSNVTCLEDKKNWVADHLGEDWLDSLIFTKDKTRVVGDILFDDKPEIHGEYEGREAWIQILVDQSYNREVKKPRLTHWIHWAEKVEEVLDRTYAL